MEELAAQMVRSQMTVTGIQPKLLLHLEPYSPNFAPNIRRFAGCIRFEGYYQGNRVMLAYMQLITPFCYI